jgi:hypothetical protein
MDDVLLLQAQAAETYMETRPQLPPLLSSHLARIAAVTPLVRSQVVAERATTLTARLADLRRESFRDILSLVALLQHGLRCIERLRCPWCGRPLPCLYRRRGRVKTNYPPHGWLRLMRVRICLALVGCFLSASQPAGTMSTRLLTRLLIFTSRMRFLLRSERFKLS